MKLLITGGCGFLGSNLAASSLEHGDEVVLFDNLSRLGSHQNLSWLEKQGELEFVHGDIRSENDVSKTIRECSPDAVFHLAGQVAMTDSIADPRADFQTNALGTSNVLEALRQWAPEAPMVYSSTNKVYGDLEQFTYTEDNLRYECVERPDGFDERTPLDFRSPYGCSKGAADQYVLDYARIFGLKTVVFRHSSMFGGRQFSTFDQGWIGWFCQKAFEVKKGLAKARFTISGTGKQVRDVLHCDDMKRLYRLALANIDGVAGNAFNIGGGMSNSLSLLELFARLEQELDVTLDYTKLPQRECDQLVFVADHSKATRMLGWKPEVDVGDGLKKMMQWIEDQDPGKS